MGDDMFAMLDDKKMFRRFSPADRPRGEVVGSEITGDIRFSRTPPRTADISHEFSGHGRWNWSSAEDRSSWGGFGLPEVESFLLAAGSGRHWALDDPRLKIEGLSPPDPSRHCIAGECGCASSCVAANTATWFVHLFAIRASSSFKAGRGLVLG